MVEGTRYIFLLIRLLLRAASGSRRTPFKLNGSQAIRRRFLENVAERRDDRSLHSFFSLRARSSMLWEPRRSKATSFFQDRLFGFRKPPTWMPRKGCSPDHRRFLVHVSQEMSYTRAALRRRHSRVESCPGNFERKHSSSPLCALRRLSRERY